MSANLLLASFEGMPCTLVEFNRDGETFCRPVLSGMLLEILSEGDARVVECFCLAGYSGSGDKCQACWHYKNDPNCACVYCMTYRSQ